jgi:hypothetical protein
MTCQFLIKECAIFLILMNILSSFGHTPFESNLKIFDQNLFKNIVHIKIINIKMMNLNKYMQNFNPTIVARPSVA